MTSCKSPYKWITGAEKTLPTEVLSPQFTTGRGPRLEETQGGSFSRREQTSYPNVGLVM